MEDQEHSEGVQLDPVGVPALQTYPQEKYESLSPQEGAYLRQLEATNKLLTIELGDMILALDAKKFQVTKHRLLMQEAYTNSLRLRNIKEGYIDSARGVIHVISKNEERG